MKYITLFQIFLKILLFKLLSNVMEKKMTVLRVTLKRKSNIRMILLKGKSTIRMIYVQSEFIHVTFLIRPPQSCPLQHFSTFRTTLISKKLDLYSVVELSNSVI